MQTSEMTWIDHKEFFVNIHEKEQVTNRSHLYERPDMISVYFILIGSVVISFIVAIYILIMISSSKSLHSPANLLVFNTSLKTIFLVIICTFNASYFFMELPFTDYQCRLLAYLTYAFLTSTAYSYVIQSISRLFFTVFHHHRKLLSYKFHFLLILIQTCTSYLLPLPSIITDDITYRPLFLCIIPMKYPLHVAYFFFSSYFIPLFLIVTIHLVIHRRVIMSSRMLKRISYSNKRDLQLTRNIVILFIIFFLAGFPGFIYFILSKITSSSFTSLYMLSFSATCLTAAIEKLLVISLNQDLRRETRKRFGPYIKCYRMNRTGVENGALPFIISTTKMTREIRA